MHPPTSDPEGNNSAPLQEHPADESYPHIEKTRFWEGLRAICTSSVTTNSSVLIHLVAVQGFDASPDTKKWLVSASFIGLLAAPVSTWIVSHLRVPITQATAVLNACAGVGLIFAGLSHSLLGYFWGLMLGLPLMASATPNITALWCQNIPDHLRGVHYSKVMVLSRIGGCISAIVISAWMGGDAHRYRPVLILLGLALIAAGWFSLKTPSRALKQQGLNPLASISYLWRDRLFGYVSMSWMFMGFGNLLISPLRVEFVSNANVGFKHEPWIILCLLTVIPEIGCVLTVRFWGRVFDRTNFLTMRIILNCFFILSPLLFFHPSIALQVLGAACLGVGFGGGEIAWSLWVTKVAPPERTADYMSVHTFMNGIRGIAGPFIAFHFLADTGVHPMVWFGVSMILVSCLMLMPILKYGDKPRMSFGKA